MTDEITRALFDHLVALAALDLQPDEAEYLRHQMNNQLKALHELDAIPLESNTPAASHGVPYTTETTPAIRRDEWVPYENPGQILAQAPETADGYIVVPEIPHTDLV
jgi:aspartyl-tRNA(Asn)/glutamyl-tRNA(Gln) amidotransferase subunit C